MSSLPDNSVESLPTAPVNTVPPVDTTSKPMSILLGRLPPISLPPISYEKLIAFGTVQVMSQQQQGDGNTIASRVVQPKSVTDVKAERQINDSSDPNHNVNCLRLTMSYSEDIYESLKKDMKRIAGRNDIIIEVKKEEEEIQENQQQQQQLQEIQQNRNRIQNENQDQNQSQSSQNNEQSQQYWTQGQKRTIPEPIQTNVNDVNAPNIVNGIDNTSPTAQLEHNIQTPLRSRADRSFLRFLRNLGCVCCGSDSESISLDSRQNNNLDSSKGFSNLFQSSKEYRYIVRLKIPQTNFGLSTLNSETQTQTSDTNNSLAIAPGPSSVFSNISPEDYDEDPALFVARARMSLLRNRRGVGKYSVQQEAITSGEEANSPISSDPESITSETNGYRNQYNQRQQSQASHFDPPRSLLHLCNLIEYGTGTRKVWTQPTAQELAQQAGLRSRLNKYQGNEDDDGDDPNPVLYRIDLTALVQCRCLPCQGALNCCKKMNCLKSIEMYNNADHHDQRDIDDDDHDDTTNHTIIELGKSSVRGFQFGSCLGTICGSQAFGIGLNQVSFCGAGLGCLVGCFYGAVLGYAKDLAREQQYYENNGKFNQERNNNQYQDDSSLQYDEISCSSICEEFLEAMRESGRANNYARNNGTGLFIGGAGRDGVGNRRGQDRDNMLNDAIDQFNNNDPNDSDPNRGPNQTQVLTIIPRPHSLRPPIQISPEVAASGNFDTSVLRRRMEPPGEINVPNGAYSEFLETRRGRRR